MSAIANRRTVSRRCGLAAAAIALGLTLTASNATAQLALYDSFESAGASLNGYNGWSTTPAAQPNLTTATAGPMSFSPSGSGTIGGAARYLQVRSVNQNDLLFRTLSPALSSNDIFISFLMRYESTGATLDNNDFAAFWFDTVTGTLHTTVPAIGIKANRGTGAGTEDIYIRPALSSEVFRTNIVPGQTYFIIGQLSKVGGVYRRYDLWVNPEFGDASTPQASITAPSGTFTQFTRFGIRTANLDTTAPTGPDRVNFDALRVGSTWASVFPNSPLAVTLTSFNAQYDPLTRGVNITWTTGQEINTQGFHVHRANPDGSLGARITAEAIASTSSQTGESSNTYTFTDNLWWVSSGGSRSYYLTEIETDGRINVLGPYAIDGLPMPSPVRNPRPVREIATVVEAPAQIATEP